MSEPIKLPNMPFDLYHGIQDCDQYNAIRKYTTDAVEQATADLRKEFDSYENFSCQLVAALRKERDEAIHDHDTAQERIHEQFREIQSLLKECDEACAEVERLRAELEAMADLAETRRVTLDAQTSELCQLMADKETLLAVWKGEEAEHARETEDRIKAEAELAEKSAELARLTTLRPASEHKTGERVLIWEEARLHADRWLFFNHGTRVPTGAWWTPLPDVKEPK